MKRKWAIAALVCAVAALSGAALADGPSDAGTALQAAARGNYALAVRYYTRALWSGDLTPAETGAAYYNRAHAYVRLADYGKALEDYGRVIEIEPGYAAAYYNRAVTRTAQGDLKAALVDYGNAIRLGYSDLYKPLFNRGEIYESQGDLERAVADFKAAYALAPEEAPIRAKLEALGQLR